MALLTPEEHGAVTSQALALWARKLEETKPHMDEAGAALAEALATRSLNMRDIWLVVAVFEKEEELAKEGRSDSCRSVWFDKIAPRAKPGKYPFHGISGYCASTARKATQFLIGSGNGYVRLTDLGYALVQWLRMHNDSIYLGPDEIPDYKKGIPLPSLGEGIELPYPHWRR